MAGVWITKVPNGELAQSLRATYGCSYHSLRSSGSSLFSFHHSVRRPVTAEQLSTPSDRAHDRPSRNSPLATGDTELSFLAEMSRDTRLWSPVPLKERRHLAPASTCPPCHQQLFINTATPSRSLCRRGLALTNSDVDSAKSGAPGRVLVLHSGASSSSSSLGTPRSQLILHAFGFSLLTGSFALLQLLRWEDTLYGLANACAGRDCRLLG